MNGRYTSQLESNYREEQTTCSMYNWRIICAII